MATIAKDLRRHDDNRTLWNPYWMVSSEVKPAEIVANAALLWSFPAAKYSTRTIIVQNIAVQLITAYTGGTPAINIGSGTIATDVVTTAGTLTVVDADEYVPAADVTCATPATYFAATGDWITAYLLKTNLAPVIITPADATVPCIYASCAASAAAGLFRVLVQVVEVPTM
jgi:hypothetical protein